MLNFVKAEVAKAHKQPNSRSRAGARTSGGRPLLELLLLAIIVAAAMAVTAVAVDPIGRALRRVETVLAQISAAIIAFVMLFVAAEVTMRYAFNSPIPAISKAPSC